MSAQTPEKTTMSIRVLETNYIRSLTFMPSVRMGDYMWNNQTSGIVKLNVDASFHADTLSGASEAVERDDKGEVIAATNWFILHIRYADVVELLVITNGIYLLSSIGCTKAKVESNCSFALECLKLLENYMGPHSAVMAECKQLSIDFAKLSFGHCFREANQVADELAKQRFRPRSSGSWDSSVLDFISHLLVNDVTII
ncbi:Bidirectional sugar transporter SWEET14 [Hordeum vulgare]|nr:Bidirectional sugar transporter SWEET14 [Hordeum vulgare]